ncbi:MAG TPA: hypothetical protein VID47_17395 [Actinomycetota bacterium]|jgi:hypothetical protein
MRLTSTGARRRRGLRFMLPAILVGLSLLLSACGGDGYTYTGNQGNHVFLKVPSSWAAYNGNIILKAIGLDGTPSAKSFNWLAAFDASPTPKLGHVLSGVPKQPVILAYVRQLSPQTRDQFSLQALRNARYPIDQLVNNDQGDLISSKDISLKGGLYGEQDVFDVTGGIGDISAANGALMVNQIGILDPGNHKLYLLVISCAATCYERNRNVIDEVARSYSVKET